MQKKAIVAFMLLYVILVAGCRRVNQQGAITSGMIEYKIRYLNDDLGGKLEDLLPGSMELVFDQEQAVNYIDGFLGMYSFNTVTDFTTRKCSTLLQVFERNYLYKGRRGELMCCFDPMEDMVIEETGETSVIAGFTCKRAIVSFPSGEKSFEVFYTQDIDLQHPNQNNPYKSIDGVLIRFELQLFHLRMEFMAKEFSPQSGRRPGSPGTDNAAEVNREQMTQILRKLLE